MNKPVVVAPSLTDIPTKIVDGISIYDRKDYNTWFETEYSSTTEPWEYSHRAAELYRHIYTVQQIRRYNAEPQTLLELACSKGLMTELLIPLSHSIYATDVSLTAVKACKQRCHTIAEKNNCHIEYFITTTPGLPFADNSFDVVTVCDGLVGWWFSEEQIQLALKDIYRVLKKGGIAILTDYLLQEPNKNVFKEYENNIRSGPFSIMEISFLYDIPWYKLESFLKKTGLERKLGGLLTSIPLAKTLNSIGRLIGRKAARHIVMVVRKE